MTKPLVKIEIIFDGENVMISGPIQDKILCLGMLELAKQIVVNGAKIQNKVELRPFMLDENGHNKPVS